MSSGNTQAHPIDNRDRGTTDIKHSQIDLETNRINLNEGLVQVVGVNRLTHICRLAHNISIAQNEAQLSSGENTANQINLFFLFFFSRFVIFFIFIFLLRIHIIFLLCTI